MCLHLPPFLSLPAWGVWIEISVNAVSLASRLRHSPHGECGLKSKLMCLISRQKRSLPAWGVWIEIGRDRRNDRKVWSLPAWGVWIEICANSFPSFTSWSLPAWGVWIEIAELEQLYNREYCHSPHGECGLKSLQHTQITGPVLVTPRMGSVD